MQKIVVEEDDERIKKNEKRNPSRKVLSKLLFIYINFYNILNGYLLKTNICWMLDALFHSFRSILKKYDENRLDFRF